MDHVIRIKTESDIMQAGIERSSAIAEITVRKDSQDAAELDFVNLKHVFVSRTRVNAIQKYVQGETHIFNKST